MRHGHTSQQPGSRRSAARLLLCVLLAAACRQAVGAQQSTTPYLQTVLQVQGYIEGGRLDEAQAALSTALKQYPSDGGLENLLGVVNIRQGHVELAKSDFSKAIRHSPKLTSAYLNLARLDLQTSGKDQGGRIEALRLYARVVELDPQDAEARYQEAAVLLSQHLYQRSLDALALLDAKTRRQPQVEAVACADAIALGDRKSAEREASRLETNPKLTEQDVLTVVPALRAGHRADLIDALFSAVGARKPLSAAGLHYLGLAQEAEGKSEQARTTFERMFAMDNTSAAPLRDLAQIALADEDDKAALGYLAQARALKPADASLPYEFGVVCLKMNLIGAARSAFGDAVRLQPDNPQYNLVLGTLLSSAEGLPYLKKYQQLEPGRSVGALALGVAYFQANDFDHSSAWLTRAAADRNTAAAAHDYLGRILLQQGHSVQAVAELLKSSALKADQPDVLAELGSAYLQMGKYAQAEDELNRAIALDSANYTANFALARLYARTNDPRRQQQEKRFAEIRNQGAEQYREAMRIVEARPEPVHPEAP